MATARRSLYLPTQDHMCQPLRHFLIGMWPSDVLLITLDDAYT